MEMVNVIDNFVIAFALYSTIYFAKRNQVIGKFRTKCYISVSAVIIGMILIDSVRLMTYTYVIPSSELIHNLNSMLIYIFEPFVPILLFYNTYFRCRSKKMKAAYIAPAAVNAVLSVISYFNGIVYSYSESGEFVKGPLYFVPVALLFIYYIAYIILFFRYPQFDKRDLKVFVFIYFLPAFGIIIQITNYYYTVAWNITAVALMLYYIALREMSYRYDELTKIKNRAAFDFKMLKLSHYGEKVGIVMIDINNLKRINDNFGHSRGDAAIIKAAELCVNAFYKIGTPFRIGGDEYCILCEGVEKEQLESALVEFKKSIEESNQLVEYNFTVAYGYSFYDRSNNSGKTIYDVFEVADSKMYQNKRQQELLL